MGPLGWVLTLLAANGALMAALLLAASGDRAAGRFLSALVGLISLRLVVYVLGFAGLYDNHPWITFAPLDASLAFGPLLWLYLVSLTRGAPPVGWWLHLLPAAAQLGYSLALFMLPLDAKLRWYAGAHLRLVEPLGLTAMLLSGGAYLVLAWRRKHGYRRWLDERFADRDRWRLSWMTAVLAAFALMLAAACLAALTNVAVRPLGYIERTPVVIASSLIAYALGLLGWRHAGLDLPVQPVAGAEPEPEPSASLRSPPAAAFPAWSRRVAAEGWWREEGLTLAQVASRLAVSERTLSRGLAEGGGCSFNTFINRLRVEAIKRALAEQPHADLLGLALDCGFSSKASFNRAFRQHAGTTPSAWRAVASQKTPITAAGAI